MGGYCITYIVVLSQTIQCDFHFLQSKEFFFEDSCTIDKCSLNVPIPAEGSTYCFSAKGSFFESVMLGAQSEESCIDVPPKQTFSKRILKLP